MRKLTAYLLLFCHVTAASVLGANPKLLREIDLDNNDTLVFLGDSITRQCLYTQYVEDFYYTRYPTLRLRFHNSGVGGDRAADALVRFDEDVAPLKPKYVTVLLGMNDGSYEEYSRSTFRVYEKDMSLLMGKITGLDAQPIIMTPTMFDLRAYRGFVAGGNQDTRERSPYYNGALASYGAWLREQAFEKGFGFVDLYSPLNRLTVQQRKSNPDFTLTIEGIHPNPIGHLVMAYAFLTEMADSDTVSSIHVLQEEGIWQVKTTGGTATELRTAKNISFTFLANSLPWVVPDEALPGYQLVEAGSKLSRETLRVSDLAQGRYQLRIDESNVGNFSHLELACGIELQENINTPQYQQARQVAQLNKERNEKGVAVLREQWTQAKDRRQQGPSDNASFERWYASFPEKVEKLRKLITEFEDRVYHANQPIPHKYEIIRMAHPD